MSNKSLSVSYDLARLQDKKEFFNVPNPVRKHRPIANTVNMKRLLSRDTTEESLHIPDKGRSISPKGIINNQILSGELMVLDENIKRKNKRRKHTESVEIYPYLNSFNHKNHVWTK